MRVSVVQMNPGADKAENIAQARRLIDAGGRRPTGPTSSACRKSGTASAATRDGKFAQAEELPAKGSNAPGGAGLRVPARDRPRRAQSTCTAARSSRSGGDKLFNTTVVFDPDGQEIARYRKMHLFDIVAPDGTGYPRKQHLRRRRRDRHLRGRRHHGRRGHLLRPALPGTVLRAAPRRAPRSSSCPRPSRCRPARTIGRR